MKIDVHVHYYPRDYVTETEALATDATRDRSWSAFKTGFVAGDPTSYSVEDCLDAMDKSGVDMSVLSLSIPNVYFPDPDKSLYLAQMTNDAFAEICRKHPQRFMSLASIPWEFPELAIPEMHRAIEQLGMHGLVIGGNIRGKLLDAPLFRPIFEEADKLNLTILIHPMIPTMIESLEDYGLGPTIGYLFDSTTAITRLVFSGLFERCPNLRMIVPHMGGFVPFNMERIDNTVRSRPGNARNMTIPPSQQFKRHYFDTANYHLPAVRCGYESVGAEHILLGSDFPFRSSGAGPAIANVRALGLSVEEEEMIFGGNALGLFRR